MFKIRPLLFFIIAIAFFCRAYAYTSRYIYAHDSDLASWIVKDIVVDHHLRLIGQLTSSPGIFIGPIFYYSLIPFYFLTRMDPIGSVAFSWIIGVVSSCSIYWVFSRVHTSKVGLIGSLIHAASFGLSVNEREVVPTTPVMLWSVWFYYSIHQLLVGNKKSLWLLGLLFALVWHLNLALGLLASLVLIGLVSKRKLFKVQDLFIPALIFIILSLPLIVFEVRHNFQQSQALFSTLNVLESSQSNTATLVSKFQKTALYAVKNVNAIFWFDTKLGFVIPILLLVGLILVNLSSLWLFALWFALYWVFFSFIHLNLSEYYLNGLNILWVSMAAQVLAKLNRVITLLLITGFLAVNLNLQLTTTYSKNGYLQKKAIVQAIKNDASAHNFPCISISYITDPGYDLGYRYFVYLAGLKLRPISLKVPVYSIVFPLSRVDQLDQTYGDLGLILPDYGKYPPETVKIDCMQPDINLTDSMFGFTK
jgi:4-amino-4-deoxy-L-arabinose transferase-like glycosyltransferase